MIKQFSRETIEKLKYYVYALVDPTNNNQIFYIGKGKGNRIFQHLKSAENDEEVKKDEEFKVDAITKRKYQKLQRIRNIINNKKEPGHFIIRYGLTSEHALIVESVLIDLFQHKFKDISFDNLDGLDNLINGYDSQGVISVEQLELLYGGKQKEIYAKILETDKIIAINVSIDSLDQKEIYDRVKGHWRVNVDRANKAEYVVATHAGLIIGVFKRDMSKPWTKSPHPNEENRYGFQGEESKDESINERLFRKRLDRTPRSRNPIKYFGI